MAEEKLISAPDEESLWLKLTADLSAIPDLLEYHATLQQDEMRVLLDIEIDPGGGFEGGYGYTSFSSFLFMGGDFRFAIHQQSFVDEIGKFFGMQDVKLGYPEFDERFIVKTNDPSKCRALFEDVACRSILQQLPDCSFGIVRYALQDNPDSVPFLELRLDEAVTNPDLLRSAYAAFSQVLNKLNLQ